MSRRYAMLTALALGLLALPAHSGSKRVSGNLPRGPEHVDSKVAVLRALGEFRDLSIIFERN